MTPDEPISLGYLSLTSATQVEVEKHVYRALPDPAVDPGGYILAVCDLRLDRAAAADVKRATVRAIVSRYREALRVFVVAEANEALVLAEVALWRGIVERHGDHGGASNYRGEPDPALCHGCAERWPCPDLLAVVATAQAYAGTP